MARYARKTRFDELREGKTTQKQAVEYLEQRKSKQTDVFFSSNLCIFYSEWKIDSNAREITDECKFAACSPQQLE